MAEQLHRAIIDGFGDEWSRFDQSALSTEERETLWSSYFAGFPWDALARGAEGFDAGCGSGRWATLVAPRVGVLHCLDASGAALAVARRNLAAWPNVSFHEALVEETPLAPSSQDFGYALGVLHHTADPARALRHLVSRLKPGAPLLVYLYYAFDNRPAWYRALWRLSEPVRRAVSRSPHGLRYAASQVLAGAVYWPLSRSARLAERLGRRVDQWPLAFYRHRSFYVMRTDALDRFGARLERRFSRSEIAALLEDAGLERIRFNERPPYWSAVGYRRRGSADVARR